MLRALAKGLAAIGLVIPAICDSPTSEGIPGETVNIKAKLNWIILKPLPTGEHKIGFKGISVDFTTGAKNTFVSDATYNVIVR